MNISRLSSSSLGFPLNDSIYPFSRGLPNKMLYGSIKPNLSTCQLAFARNPLYSFFSKGKTLPLWLSCFPWMNLRASSWPAGKYIFILLCSFSNLAGMSVSLLVMVWIPKSSIPVPDKTSFLLSSGNNRLWLRLNRFPSAYFPPDTYDFLSKKPSWLLPEIFLFWLFVALAASVAL